MNSRDQKTHFYLRAQIFGETELYGHRKQKITSPPWL